MPDVIGYGDRLTLRSGRRLRVHVGAARTTDVPGAGTTGNVIRRLLDFAPFEEPG